MGQSDALLFITLARVAELRVDNLNPQDLANIAWAFATVGLPDALLLMVLARVAEFCVDSFDQQMLANTA